MPAKPSHSAACTPVVRDTRAQLRETFGMVAARLGITERRREAEQLVLGGEGGEGA